MEQLRIRLGSVEADPVCEDATRDDVPPEATECSICSRRFNILMRQSRCHTCGRAICTNCGTGERFSRVRICHICHETQQDDKSCTIVEDLNNSREMGALLRVNLKEKLGQSEWFRSFLLKVCYDREYICSIKSPPRSRASSFDEVDNVDDSLVDAETQALIERARARWKRICSDLSASMNEVERFEQQCHAANDASDKCDAVARAHKREVDQLQAESKGYTMTGAIVNGQRLAKIKALEEELDGLSQRAAALQAAQVEEPPPKKSSSLRCRSVSGSGVGFFNSSSSSANSTQEASSRSFEIMGQTAERRCTMM